MTKFYVFDQYDCFDHCDTLEAASDRAAWLIANQFTGVHILQLTEKEFEDYCKNG